MDETTRDYQREQRVIVDVSLASASSSSSSSPRSAAAAAAARVSFHSLAATHSSTIRVCQNTIRRERKNTRMIHVFYSRRPVKVKDGRAQWRA